MAVALTLFGRRFDLAGKVTPVAAAGSFGATGSITLKSVNAVAIVLDGPICGVRVALDATFTCRQVGDVLTLEKRDAGGVGLKIELDGKWRDIRNPDIRPSGDARTGLLLVAPNSEGFRWLADGPRLPPALMMRSPFPGTDISLDAAAGTALHRPSQPLRATFTWRDQFDGDTPIGPEQVLRADALTFRGASYEFEASPAAGALFLHADVLDTSPPQGFENEMLFQYAVANGRVVASGTTDAPLSQLAWRGRGGVSPALLLFRHQDEHGAPLVFLPDGELPLVERHGIVQALAPDERNASFWEQTNRAMVIGAHRGAREIRGRLASLDVDALYDVMASPDQRRNGFDAPWFVKDGSVPIDGASTPGEIHNLAADTWLRRKASPGVSATATIKVAPHAQAALTVFHTTTLELPAAAEWTLTSLRAERDLKPDDGGALQVGAYRSSGLPGTAVALPAVDYAYAVANLAGGRRGKALGGTRGEITRIVKGELALLDRQFVGDQPGAFEGPAMPAARHVDGAGVLAAPRGYARLLDQIPVEASVAGTALGHPQLTGARVLEARSALLGLAPASRPSTHLVLGGKPQGVESAVRNLGRSAEAAAGRLNGIMSNFAPRWRQLAKNSDVAELRRKLAIPPAPTVLADRADEMIETAITLLRSGDDLGDITADGEALSLYFDDLAPVDLEERWAEVMGGAPPPGGPLAEGEVRLAPLFEHLWAPPDADLVRRVIRYLGEVLADPDVAPSVIAPRLLQLLFGTNDVAPLLAALDDVAGGIVQGVLEGLGEAWELISTMWEDVKSDVLDELRAQYGPIFTPDVYRRLLDPLAGVDARLLLDEINRWLPLELTSLADISFEPPEYLFRTARFPVLAPHESLTKALWRQAFDLCAFATEKAWSFFLDDGSSMVVKLSRRRGLDDILREIVAIYATDERVDPLGVLGQLPGEATSTTKEPMAIVDRFIATLDADLLEPGWVGVLFVRPVADLHRDRMLCDLVGFDHIAASHVAVGGRRPSLPGAATAPDICVWAHIFKEETDGPALKGDPRAEGHVQLALTKFDVRIRQTQLSDATIEVRIHPRDVWGRRKQVGEEPFPTLILHGALEPPGADAQAPRDLVFAAIFPDKLKVEVNFAFLKALSFEQLRVARRGGATSIDIDGSLLLQEADALGIDLDLDGSELRLSNFRIQLPTLRGIKVPVGTLRNLDFDFPAVSFALPNPRAVTLFGVEVIPVGLGYFRGDEAEALASLTKQYLWLRSFKPPAPKDYVAHLTAEFDFGKSPKFGLVDARGLRFRTIFAVTVDGGARPRSVAVGLGGLDARDLKLDLFGVLALQMDRLRILPATLKDEGRTEDAGALLADNLQLKIFNWSPLPKGSRFDLLMLHANGSDRGDRRKGLLAFYDAEAEATAGDAPDGGGDVPKPDEDAFFKIYWLVLAHNMKLPAKALTYLLGRGPGEDATDEYKALFRDTLDKPDPLAEPSATMAPLTLDGVGLLAGESWLFGISFRLKGLFDRCNLVLHDQHYYGIHLWAEWVETLFGMPSLELAYIPGPTRADDRFRCNLPLPKLSFLGDLSLGEIALEWSFRWDFLIDIGFPWYGPNGYDWFRAFSIPAGAYEGKFGFYVEKRTTAAEGRNEIELAAGVALYVGYFFAAGNSVAWVRAGIGVFGILEGRIAFAAPTTGNPLSIFRSTITRIEVTGVIGIFAYGEGGVDVWILSARFRVSAQASCQTRILYIANGPCTLSYRADLSAAYHASVKVGRGWFSWTFRVSGSVQMPVTGKLLLS